MTGFTRFRESAQDFEPMTAWLMIQGRDYLDYYLIIH
jgi:hypothetical protein